MKIIQQHICLVKIIRIHLILQRRSGYSVPQSGTITLKVYNLLGVEVATIFSGAREAGNYTALFDGKELASGMYLYRLQANNFVETKKFLLLK